MIRVYKAAQEEKARINETLKASFEDGDVVFILSCGSPVDAAAALFYDEKTKQIIIKPPLFKEKVDHSLKDMLIRAMLNTVRDLKGVNVCVNEEDEYYLSLGFVKNGCSYIVKADEIIFDGCCKSGL